MSQNPASDGDFCSSPSEISAGRSRGGWLVLPAGKETRWQGSAGTGTAAPSVTAPEGMEASAARRGAPSVPALILHRPGPFSALAAPPRQSCRLGEERLPQRQALAPGVVFGGCSAL